MLRVKSPIHIAPNWLFQEVKEMHKRFHLEIHKFVILLYFLDAYKPVNDSFLENSITMSYVIITYTL